MDDSNTKRIQSDFQKITRLSNEDTEELINSLADTEFDEQPMDYFLNFTNKFKELSLKTTKLEVFENNHEISLTNTVKQIGKGTYGETFLGTNSGRVFKRITYEASDLYTINLNCRNILVESFIQSVLSSDSDSKHVCKVLRIFKEKNPADDAINEFTITEPDRMKFLNLKTSVPFVLKTLQDMFIGKGLTIRGIFLGKEKDTYLIILTSKVTEKTIDDMKMKDATFNMLELGPYYFRNKRVTFFIELERLTHSFIDTLSNDVNTAKSPLDNSTFTEKYIRPVAETLQHLNHKYKFYHGDLHTGNIMFAGDTIKIIDFGLSCITYNGKRYSGELERSCISSDLGIYLVSIIEYDKKDNLLSSDTTNQLKKLLTINHKGNNYNIWSTVSEIQAKFNREIQAKFNRGKPKDDRVKDDMVMIFHVMYPWTAPWKVNNNSLIDVILSITPHFILSKLTAPVAKAKAVEEVSASKLEASAKCIELLKVVSLAYKTIPNKIVKLADPALELIEMGADLECQDKEGYSPLIWASQYRTLHRIVKALIEKGANLNHVDKDGMSALMWACATGSGISALLLVRAGAALNLVGTENKTAIDYARHTSRKDSPLDNAEKTNITLALEEMLAREPNTSKQGGGRKRTRRVKRGRSRTRRA